MGTRSGPPSAEVVDRGWKRSLDDPSPLPRGRQLLRLEDAGAYITKLPKAEHEAAEWQAAMEALILVALGGPTMFARIGVMRGLEASRRARDHPVAEGRASLGPPKAGAGPMKQVPPLNSSCAARTPI